MANETGLDPKNEAGIAINNPAVNVPAGTSDSIISGLLSNLPALFSFFQKEEKPKENFTPYYLLGGVLLLVLLTNNKK